MFICKNVDEEASGCIMLEVDTTFVTVLVPLPPCSGAGSGSGMGTGGGVAIYAAWGSWRWTYSSDRSCNRGLLLSGCHCGNLLYKLLEEDIRC